MDSESFEIQDLRTYLSNLLPKYMVPADYVRLPFLPLTSSEEYCQLRKMMRPLDSNMNLCRVLLKKKRVNAFDNKTKIGRQKITQISLHNVLSLHTANNLTSFLFHEKIMTFAQKVSLTLKCKYLNIDGFYIYKTNFCRTHESLAIISYGFGSELHTRRCPAKNKKNQI